MVEQVFTHPRTRRQGAPMGNRGFLRSRRLPRRLNRAVWRHCRISDPWRATSSLRANLSFRKRHPCATARPDPSPVPESLIHEIAPACFENETAAAFRQRATFWKDLDAQMTRTARPKVSGRKYRRPTDRRGTRQSCQPNSAGWSMSSKWTHMDDVISVEIVFLPHAA
jgi:hypothetical protein